MTAKPWQIPDGLTTLVTKLGYEFKDPKLLLQSMIHTSFAHEKGEKEDSNERLEFLGDSVLSLVISERLFATFFKSKEGVLSKMRSALVNEERLCELAEFLKLGEFLFLGTGEDKSGGREKSKNLSRAFEALIGAIFVDSSYENAKAVLQNIISSYEKENDEIFTQDILKGFDPKTKLQEEVLKTFKDPPVYKCEEVDQSTFKVQLIINGKVVEEKTGSSRKKTEKELAVLSLKNKSYQLQGEP